MGKYEYTNRDISWLSFNFRVLQEAMDKTLPLYERIKFLAIYSNNTEEFYQVRVSYYKQMLRHEREFPKQHFKNVDPVSIIKQINEIVTNQQSIFHLIFEQEIIPALRNNNIVLVDENDKLTEEQKNFVSEVFYSDIITSIQPVLLVKKKVRPFMKTGQPYMALKMVSRDSNKRKQLERYGIIKQINEIVTNQQSIFHLIFEQEIIPALRKNNIVLVDENDKLTEEQKSFVSEVFYSDIITSIQPVLLVKKKVRPFMKTGQPYMALKMVSRDSNKHKQMERYGIIKIPTDHNISRFIELPENNGKHYIMFLEDVIKEHIDAIFPGYEVKSSYSLKLTRDADMEYDEYEGDDLIDAIDRIRSARSVGKPNRFQYDRAMPQKLLDYLTTSFHISKDIMVMGGNRHNFRDFFSFPNPVYPKLEIQGLPPIPIPALANQKKPIASLIAKKDFMLSVPYQPFEHYLRFLREASTDPAVKEIKTTQYRVSDHSVVVNSLIAAAENGKKVSVFVELKARFDEEANLKWAYEMTKAGIRIIYSIPKLKVHAKIAMVIRRGLNMAIRSILVPEISMKKQPAFMVIMACLLPIQR